MSDERSADQAYRWYKVWQVLLQNFDNLITKSDKYNFIAKCNDY